MAARPDGRSRAPGRGGGPAAPLQAAICGGRLDSWRRAFAGLRWARQAGCARSCARRPPGRVGGWGGPERRSCWPWPWASPRSSSRLWPAPPRGRTCPRCCLACCCWRRCWRSPGSPGSCSRCRSGWSPSWRSTGISCRRCASSTRGPCWCSACSWRCRSSSARRDPGRPPRHRVRGGAGRAGRRAGGAAAGGHAGRPPALACGGLRGGDRRSGKAPAPRQRAPAGLRGGRDGDGGRGLEPARAAGAGRHAGTAGREQRRPARVPHASAGPHRRLHRHRRADRRLRALRGGLRGGRCPDCGEGTALGGHARRLLAARAAARGNRVPYRRVHRASRHGDREHRDAHGAGTSRRGAGGARPRRDAGRRGRPAGRCLHRGRRRGRRAVRGSACRAVPVRAGRCGNSDRRGGRGLVLSRPALALPGR